MIIDVGIFQAAGAALVVKAGSMLMEKLWGKNRDIVVAGLNGLDELLEKKTGKTFPLEVHQAYDAIVKSIVSAIDYVANPVIFRRVERAILALADPAQRANLLQEYYAIVKVGVANQISDALKAIVNSQKLDEAITAIGAHASVSIPAEFLASRDIKEDVKAAVVALKHDEPKAIDVNAQIAATRAKLDAMMK